MTVLMASQAARLHTRFPLAGLVSMPNVRKAGARYTWAGDFYSEQLLVTIYSVGALSLVDVQLLDELVSSVCAHIYDQ